MTQRIVIDSRDRLSDGEHSFVSDNSSSDFVVRLPQSIDQLTLLQCQVPLTYYVIDDHSDAIVIRVDPAIGATHEYYLIEMAHGTYDSTTISAAFTTAINNAAPLSTPADPILSTYETFVVTFDNFSKKILINSIGGSGGIQFISTPDPDAPYGIPFGDPDGFPSEMSGTTLDPLRYEMNYFANIVGIPPNTVLPNPLIDTDGFPLGVQYAYGSLVPETFPNVINLTGEDYFYVKTDLIGISNVRQGTTVIIDQNEDDITTIQNAALDRGIVEKVQINQNLFSILSVNLPNPVVVYLNEATDLINIRLTYRDNIPINLNGSETNFTIEV